MKHILRVTLAVMVTAGLLMGPAAEAHVRKANTSLSLKASKTKVHKGHKVTFTIHLKSPWVKCYQHQPVKWFKNGVYKKTVTTNDNGVVKLTKKMHNSVDIPCQVSRPEMGEASAPSCLLRLAVEGGRDQSQTMSPEGRSQALLEAHL